MSCLTEDEVRDLAKNTLHLANEKYVKAGVGQLTSFNQLGFKGVQDKPDGWYLPKNTNDVAIILETKNSNIDISKQNWINELIKNIKITLTKYKKVIGILYNGEDVIVYKNLEQIKTVNTLQNKEYYLSLFKENKIDKQQIYNVTKKINDSLHFQFGIKNLYHRMIFTACALVAERYGAQLSKIKGMDYLVQCYPI